MAMRTAGAAPQSVFWSVLNSSPLAVLPQAGDSENVVRRMVCCSLFIKDGVLLLRIAASPPTGKTGIYSSLPKHATLCLWYVGPKRCLLLLEPILQRYYMFFNVFASREFLVHRHVKYC